MKTVVHRSASCEGDVYYHTTMCKNREVRFIPPAYPHYSESEYLFSYAISKFQDITILPWRLNLG